MEDSVLQPTIILAISVVTVGFIVTGWRTDFELLIEDRYGINRTWYVPTISVVVLYVSSITTTDIILDVIVDKIDIIGLLLSFALLAEGMRESGVFNYIGSIISMRADSEYQIVIYTFIVTSVATMFTSNDIIVIAFTPVLFRVAIESGIKNLKLVLLCQFVAANTLSMTTYIGSPTNIILSEELGVNFVQYGIYMILPSLIAFITTLLVVHCFIFISQNYNILQSFQIEEYNNPDVDLQEQEFSEEMVAWTIMFLIAVANVAVLTLIDANLLLISTPISLISIIQIGRMEEVSVNESISRLPYGILFLGICFFVIGDTLISTSVVSSEVLPAIQSVINSSTSVASFLTVFITGISVNVFNDLPASAIISPLLADLSFQSNIQRIVIIQSALIGLNIGKYVTQVGALAGLVWFNQIHVEVNNTKSKNIIIPSRLDLLKFGLINFVINGIVLSIFVILEYSALVLIL